MEVKTCPNGHPVQEGVALCPACGVSVPVTHIESRLTDEVTGRSSLHEPIEEPRCPKGHLYRSDWSQCPTCNRDAIPGVRRRLSAIPTAAEAGVESSRSTASGWGSCPKCGTARPFADLSPTCPGCGADWLPTPTRRSIITELSLAASPEAEQASLEGGQKGTAESKCPNGHPVDVSFAFCPACGDAVPVLCPKGHRQRPGDRFCPQCGAANRAVSDVGDARAEVIYEPAHRASPPVGQLGSSDGNPSGSAYRPVSPSVVANGPPFRPGPYQPAWLSSSATGTSSLSASRALASGYRQQTLEDASSTTPAGAWLAIIGGLISGIGSFLPWFSATVPLLGTLNRNGFQLGSNDSFSADRLIAILLSIVTIIIGIARLTNSSMPRFIQRSSIVTGIVLIIVGASDIGSVNTMVKNVENGSSSVLASIGFGLYLVIVGGVVALVGGLVLRRRDSPW